MLYAHQRKGVHTIFIVSALTFAIQAILAEITALHPNGKPHVRTSGITALQACLAQGGTRRQQADFPPEPTRFPEARTRSENVRRQQK